MDTTREARLAAVAVKQHGAFSHSQALEAGFTFDAMERRERSGAWIRVAHDVLRVAGAPPTWRQRLMAATLEARGGAVASHRSAGALFGVPGFGPGPLEVLQLRGGHHRKTVARVHETPWLPDAHVTAVDGIPCTTIARFMFDIAGTEHPKRVERAFDSALHRLGLTIPATTHVVATMARRGRPGSRLMRRLLEARGPGYVPPESELESLFIEVCEAYGIPVPDKQLPVGGQRRIGRVDFIDRRAKLVIEVQSETYHGSWMAQREDMERRADLAAAGYRVLEITYHQLVHEPDATMRRLREARRVAA